MKSLLKDTTKVIIFLCFFFIILIMKFAIGYMTLTWYSDIVRLLMYACLASFIYFTKRELFDTIDIKDVTLKDSFNFKWKNVLIKYMLIILLATFSLELVLFIVFIFEIDLEKYFVIYAMDGPYLSRSAFEGNCKSLRKNLKDNKNDIKRSVDTMERLIREYKCIPTMYTGPSSEMGLTPRPGYNPSDTQEAKDAFSRAFRDYNYAKEQMVGIKQYTDNFIHNVNLIPPNWGKPRDPDWVNRAKNLEEVRMNNMYDEGNRLCGKMESLIRYMPESYNNQ